MQEVEIYTVIRQEIISNINLLNLITFFVAVCLLTGCKLIENRKTVLRVFLPLISLAWAAAVVRFDFLIHRQGIYLMEVESRMRQGGTNFPLWETWKAERTFGTFLIPLTDLLIFPLIIIPTAFIIFNYTQPYFVENQWKFGRAYAWGILISIIVLLSLTPFVPLLARI